MLLCTSLNVAHCGLSALHKGQLQTKNKLLLIKNLSSARPGQCIMETMKLWLILHFLALIINILLVWCFRIYLVLFFLKLIIYLFIFYFFWLCWVFVSVRGLSLVVASGGHSSSRCAGLSLSRPLLLWSTSSRRAGSVVVAHGPNCSAACGIFPDQCSNPCALHWQADSQPLRHQGSPYLLLLKEVFYLSFATIPWSWISVTLPT